MLLLCLLTLLAPSVFCQLFDESPILNEASFIEIFSKCKRGSRFFDLCIRDALNNCRPYFKTGVPELDIPPFDPFFAAQVEQVRRVPGARAHLRLINVTESGWTQSLVTSFKSDASKQTVQYTQFFPEKYLEGAYEFEGTIMATTMRNKGFWNITLYDYVQITTISRPPNSKTLKVFIEVKSTDNLDLHISNLLHGRRYMEFMLDRVINTTWRPFFPVLRPLISDLVTTAFTKIFNRALNHLDLNKILP